MTPRKLGLGTVQFGLPYGVTNGSGQVAEPVVADILRLARQEGLTTLDTAAAYGDSEAVLGRCLPGDWDCRIVTKIPAVNASKITPAVVAGIAAGFRQSLQQLGRPAVDGLLLHRADDLLLPGAEWLYEQLLCWREEGLVRRIGVSLYDRPQLDALLARYVFDLVQLPLNVFDQRLLADGSLAVLQAEGIAIHVRSLFLQGLLLQSPAAIPAAFAPWQGEFARYHAALAAAGLSPLAAALGFIRQLAEVELGVIGVLSPAHLAECLAAYDAVGAASSDFPFADFAATDLALLDPRQWPRA